MHIPALLRSSFFLAGAFAPWLAAADDAPSDVIDLTADTLPNFITGDGVSLVEFFAPWCGHCKALAPEYELAATALKEKGIQLAKIDCVEHGDLCQSQGIFGYPTLKVFKNGTESEYDGPRKADGIVSYMVKQSLPAVTPVTAENHEEIKVADKIVVIAYLSQPDDAPAPAFSAAAETHRNSYLFGLTHDEAAIKAAGVTPPAIVLYKKFDEGRDDMPADQVEKATNATITSFIKANANPLFDEVSGENYQIYAQSGLPLAYLFIDPTDKDALEATLKELTPVAVKHKGKINFVWIDAVKFSEHGKNLGLTEGRWPAFIIQTIENQLKYPLDTSKETTLANVEAHVDAFVAGKLNPVLKSEPVPEEQDQKYFKLVGSEFEKVVYDDEKDVFVQFSAPWCGHCKRLLPTWETLGETFKDSEKLVIAKMDATENDLPPSSSFVVSGFPTIKFKPAGSRDFIDYEGDRSLDDLIDFVNKSAKHQHIPKKPAPPVEKVEEKVEELESAEEVVEAAEPAEVHDEL